MDTWFELWDARNASLVGTYDTQDDALSIVRHALASFGVDSVASLVLTSESDGADPQVIASGEELIALTQRNGVAVAG